MSLMPLRIKCPSGHSLIVSESRAGQTFRCPKCQGEVRVPGESPTKPPPPVASRPPEEMKPQATQPAFESKPVVKPPVTKQPPLPPPKEKDRWRKEEPTTPVAAAAFKPPITPPPPPPIPTAPAREIKKVEPPPVILRVAQFAAENPAIPSPPPAPPPAEPAPPPVLNATEPSILALPPAVSPPEPIPASGIPAEAAPPAPIAPTPRAPVPRLPPPSPAVEFHPPLIHSPQQITVVFQLAAAMIVAAVFSIFPSAWDLFAYVSGTSASPLGRWAIVLGMLGAVQVAYAFYLIQLPDWTTVWMVTLFALASAALYAMALGLTIISGEDGWLVRFLQISDKVAGGKAALWCLCMMSVMTLLAFFAGRISVRWRQAEAVLREAT
ncbi:MAG: hypothetical protein ACR2FY_01465 [Pirellulaceae bacterium]